MSGILKKYNENINQWESVLIGEIGPQGIQGPTGVQGNVGPGDIINSGPDAITSFWAGTQAQYDALGTYSVNTLYFVRN